MLAAVRFAYRVCKNASLKLFAVTLGLELSQALFLTLDTFLLKLIIDAINNKSLAGVSLIGIIVFRLVFQLAKTVIERTNNMLWAVFKDKQTVYLNSAFIDKVASLDLAHFENSKTVGLLSRILPRLQWQFNNFLSLIYNVLYGAMGLIIPLIIFVSVSPWAALFIIAANVLVLIVNTSMNRSYFNIFKANDVRRRQFGYTMDLVTSRDNLPEIKMFQAFDFVKNRLLKVYREFIDKEIKNDRKYQLIMIGVEALPAFAAFAFLYLSAQQVESGSITIGTFVLIFTNMLVFANALSTLRRNLSVLNADSRFMLEIDEFFQIQPYISFPKLGPRHSTLKKELTDRLENPTISVENLSFSYPNSTRQVLNDITLTIPHGTNLAIVGENGAGKTTLVKLLLRIYEPTKGKISINGININLIPEDMLYGLYSTLFQDFGKFYLTIRENLELSAKRHLGKDEMKKYLKLSNAWEFIRENSRQFDQQLGVEYENGIDISGGQWQRLGIARALSKDAPILILDEPTSAIDAKAEAAIFDRLIKHAKNKTMVFISHRFSTIKDAEKIVVMHHGRIIEKGTHQELMQINKHYAGLYNVQAQRYQRT